MAGFVPAIFFGGHEKDARDKPGHDGCQMQDKNP
jgi:hypothetical protein